jgi:isoleucyl-tRNA synthetase
LLKVRAEVTKALELARESKQIGHPLEASVTVFATGERLRELEPYREQLREFCIVSAAQLIAGDAPADAFVSSELEGLAVRVEPAAGQKCQRCWIHDPSVDHDPEYPGICTRCRQVLAKLPRH